MNSEKAIANQTSDNLTNENLSFDERLVLEVYRENKETGNSSLLLTSKSLSLLPYINFVKISSKAVMDSDILLEKAAVYFICYGYIEASVNASHEDIGRMVSKAAELGLLGFEHPSQPDKVCCISDVCIYKHKTYRFNKHSTFAGLVHANLKPERFSNFGVFAYPSKSHIIIKQ